MCKCSECGFLMAEQDFFLPGNMPTKEKTLSEVTGSLRDRSSETAWNHYTPICFRTEEICKENATADEKRQEVFRERDCSKYFSYIFGYIPKEHSELEYKERRESKQWRKTLKTGILSLIMGACLRPIIELGSISSWDEVPRLAVPIALFVACFCVLMASKD